jgi:sulfoxide reductase heme-binding subunit YedZ
MGLRVPGPPPAEKHMRGTRPLRARERSGRSSYWRRRIRRHIGLALGSAALTAGIFCLVRSDYLMFRLSMASAYAGLALLGAALATGPWNVLRGRPNPVSTDLRRDIGIWAGVLGLLHVAVGLQVHAGGNIWHYFFYPPAPQRLLVRLDPFGFANHTGLIVTLVLAVLLALSNDRSLRWLGTRRWKLAQQSAYVGFALVVAHGALYQLIEKRNLLLVALFAAMAAAVTAFQLAGFRRMRVRARRATSGASVPASSSGRQSPASPRVKDTPGTRGR